MVVAYEGGKAGLIFGARVVCRHRGGVVPYVVVLRDRSVGGKGVVGEETERMEEEGEGAENGEREEGKARGRTEMYGVKGRHWEWDGMEKVAKREGGEFEFVGGTRWYVEVVRGWMALSPN